MQLDDQLLVGHIPAQDRQVRLLLDSGRFDEADAVFDELIAVGAAVVDARWNRSTVLVHRASLAWRLGRLSLALELVTDGWTEMDLQHPSGSDSAHTISMLGHLLEIIGRRGPALNLMELAVEIARDTDDPDALAYCLANEGIARVLHASGGAGEFAIARQRCAEAEEVARVGRVKRTALAGKARALAGLGEREAAETAAQEALSRASRAQDYVAAALANWVLAELRHDCHELVDARGYAHSALDGAEMVQDSGLMLRFSRNLAAICAELGDPSGEAAALRVAVRAACTSIKLLSEGLGQALEQRRVAIQTQRVALEAQEAALRDPLTGLANRLGLESLAPSLLDRCRSQGRKPWLVLLDVDWFKDVNDFAGHPAGDVVLQEVANLLRRECRSGDLLCRWAGDEFVVLLVDDSEDPREAGPVVAERIRAAVDAHDWRLVLGGVTNPPTVSIGITAGYADLQELFANADIALYRAKRAGRNRVAATPDNEALA
ncbi:sensor domain-containing diguanylate cyclase [Saccharopolyspora griseoalba]|uniref:Diguanylate cyclase n=1 Tax=Saccharopolyspora griseoalba TaxID=1431848 RepID=A0ABW2LIW7_9PSEU